MMIEIFKSHLEKAFLKNILSWIFVFFAFHANAQNANYVSSIDSFLSYLQAENAFSGRVVLQKYNQVIYTGNFNKFSNQTERFKVGSVTKVFTAIIVHQLIDEGKLSLNTTLNQFFPTIKHSEKITISQMLSHTSGIYSVTDEPGYYATRAQYFPRVSVVDIVNHNKPDFKPGTYTSYSNTNYILLGYIIEDLTKTSYAQNIQERIANPIGLTNTYCETSGTSQPTRESSYKFNGEVWAKDIDSDPSLPFAAGAIVSTCEDLNTLMFHLFYRNLVSDSSLKVMQKIMGKNIGHGLFKAPFYERIGWGHTGRIDEFRTFVVHFPKDSLSLSINSNAMNVKLNQVIIGVLSSYYGTKFTYPTFLHSEVDSPATQIFIGKYKAKLFGFITLAHLNISQAGYNHLYLSEGKGNTEMETGLLERRGEFLFYSPDSGGELTFKTNKKGVVKGISMKQGKLTIKCKKVK